MTAPSTKDERRSYNRVQAHVTVRPVSILARAIPRRVNDVSLGGLRCYSDDEFPQFWNVLRGEMSVVGPRPPIPDEVRQYERWQRRRLSVRPGITCTWQISGRSDVSFDRWMRLDLEYIDNWSLLGDLQIFAKTIPAVLTARGAR